MLSVFPLLSLFGTIYFFTHRSFEVYLETLVAYFIVYGVLNYPGALFLFRPIDRLLRSSREEIESELEAFHSKEGDAPKNGVLNLAVSRIKYLNGYSTAWIFFIGSFYVLLTWVALVFFVSMFQESDVFIMEDLTFDLVMSFVPSLFYVHAVLPAFISYFLIYDYTMDLKVDLYNKFQLTFPPGKKRIGLTLLSAIVMLGLFPNLLVIQNLYSIVYSQEAYDQFTRNNPLITVLVDRFVILVGIIISVILITRSLTRPLNLLLQNMRMVRDGDYSAKAAIIAEDEIGVLTQGFNEMVSGLQERELIRDTFGKYVTRDVVNVILERKLNIEGEVRTCTILVTDIASYTSISEEMTPAEIVAMLNEYFSVLVNIIQEHKGVVNKFIGDSVFAMFNVPLDDPSHAENAIRAAMAIENICLTRKFGREHTLKTRVGINTGLVVAGNIGSSDRMEYTVIGDDVNVAARLEQLNKEYGTNILVGENTYLLAKDRFEFVRLGDVRLHGKAKTIGVYRLRS